MIDKIIWTVDGILSWMRKNVLNKKLSPREYKIIYDNYIYQANEHQKQINDIYNSKLYRKGLKILENPTYNTKIHILNLKKVKKK